jgi:hypothetical protein
MVRPQAGTRRPGLAFRLYGALARLSALGALALGALALGALLASQIDLRAESGGAPPGELEVKAAFVLNFIHFVYWAKIPGEENAADLPICATANSDFAEAVRRVIAGKTAGSRSISLRLDPSPNPVRCRLLLVDAADYRSARPVLNAIKGAPVLTIGNGPGFIQSGGMFELIVQDRRVQFNTNLEAIQGANLDVSARLLELSRNLKKDPKGALQ